MTDASSMPRLGARFLVLGSASPTLLQQSSESLAGRIHYHELGGFVLDEVGRDATERLWLRGGFPDAFLTRNPDRWRDWQENYFRTFVERDLAKYGLQFTAQQMRTLMAMIAHMNGGLVLGTASYDNRPSTTSGITGL